MLKKKKFDDSRQNFQRSKGECCMFNKHPDDYMCRRIPLGQTFSAESLTDKPLMNILVQLSGTRSDTPSLIIGWLVFSLLVIASMPSTWKIPGPSMAKPDVTRITWMPKHQLYNPNYSKLRSSPHLWRGRWNSFWMGPRSRQAIVFTLTGENWLYNTPYAHSCGCPPPPICFKV